MDDVSTLINALAAFAWPLIAISLLVKYRKAIRDIVGSAKSRGFTIEIGGQKLTVADISHLQQKAIEDLRHQVLELRSHLKLDSPQSDPTPAAQQERTSMSQNVLWVDDKPQNAGFFIDLLHDRSYRVTIARSTAEALELIEKKDFRLILSDLGRREDGHYISDAGVKLLESLRSKMLSVPFVVYASERGVRKFESKLTQLGAVAATSSPTDLQYILDRFTPSRD